MSDNVDPVFTKSSYRVRRKLLSFLGQKFYIYDGQGDRLLGFVKQKAFKLREDIRVYRTEDCQEEILVIKARQIVDFSAAYDVIDPTTNMKVGALRRKGWSSILRDSWQLLDSRDTEYGTIEEDSMALALVRRFLFKFLPQGFTVRVGEREVANFNQNWNIFVPTLQCDFHGGTEEIDRRVGLAAAVMMSAIEGRQQ